MTDEVQQKDRRGTFWDWPVGVALAGLLLALWAGGNDAAGGVMLGLLLIVGGVVALLVRRGTFSARGR